MYKNLNLRKEVGIAIKSKEISSQLKLIRNSYAAIILAPACSTISSTCSQMYVQINIRILLFLAHLQDFIPNLADVITYIFYTSKSRD